MATTFSGYINLQVVGVMLKTLDIGSARLDVSYTKKKTITNGTGADQANMIWTDSRNLASNTAEDIDLYGTLVNSFGDTINFTAIKAIIIVSADANTTNLTVGGDSADASTLAGLVKPGGLLVYCDPSAAGDAVVNTTQDILQIANSSGAANDYDIIIIGEV